MSGKSSKKAEWWSLLEPAPEAVFYQRGDPEDPRLGEVVHRWTGGPLQLRVGQPVLLGFPCDEGVRRNGGRVGAAKAPDAIREQLYRLTSWSNTPGTDLRELDLLDLGNLRVSKRLEAAQELLGKVLGNLLQAATIPIVLGGGHETAYGHYLGYAAAKLDCGIINVDAHLDVRTYSKGGHSGSPFRQAMERKQRPLKWNRYVVIGAQRHCVSEAHKDYVERRLGRIYWADISCTTPERTSETFVKGLARLGKNCRGILVSIDADAFRQADVPGCSAPNPVGLHGDAWPSIAGRAGLDWRVRSIELVEVNPRFDRDAQTARWAAVGLREFLVGLAVRSKQEASR